MLPPQVEYIDYYALSYTHLRSHLNRAEGGTAYTVDYANRKGLRIINLALE